MAILVEYEFVTATPLKQAMADAVRFVRSLGFESDGHDEVSFVARRGSEHPGWTVPFDDLPHYVGVTYDRGRVELVVSLATPGKPQPIHRRHVLLIAAMITDAMSPGLGPSKMVPRWNLHRQDSAEFLQKQKSKVVARGMAIGVLMCLVLAVLIGVVVAINA